MKTISGFQDLVSYRANLPEVGWIFVAKETDRDSAELLMRADFYIPENDDDEFFGEDNLATWIDAKTFAGILELREKNLTNPTIEQYMEAALHYREHDDFLE